MTMIRTIALSVLAPFAFTPFAASAHVTLANAQAPVGSYYKAVFDVPHGCKGSPTLKIRVRIPDGVLSVKPQPKAGWALETVDGPYPKTYTLHGAQVSAGVREVSWSGRLLDHHFDEFAFMAYLAPDLPPDSKLYFPVVQECEKGVSRWIDTSEPSDTPAPHLLLLPPKPR